MLFADEAREFHAGTLVWCMHCERAYPMEEMVKALDLWWCKHYPHCEGAMMDIQSWRSFRRQHPEYPEVPVVGKTYPLYPPKERV